MMNTKKKAEGDFTLCIVGLGLMGASLAMALRGFHDAQIIGLNRSEESIDRALQDGVIDEGFSWVCRKNAVIEALRRSDLVIVCLYAGAALDFFRDYARYGKPGSVWSDVTGVKESFAQRVLPYLPEGVDFLGAHPMAGRECNGYESAIPDLYQGCNYILVPRPNNRPESLALLREMTEYVGAARITIADAAQHDNMIAFTSQMAHVLASAIVQNPRLFPSEGFEGNSFGDLTRVARGISGEMWSELFVLNKRALCDVLSELEGEIRQMRQQIETGDEAGIRRTLQSTSERKERWESARAERVAAQQKQEEAIHAER